MKKVIVSLLAVMTVVFSTGCSSVSQDEYNSLQEEYNSLVEENSQLKATNESVLSEKNDLEKEVTELKNTNANLKEGNDVFASILGLQKNAISKEFSKQHSSGLYEEDTFYNENDKVSSKVIMTFDSRLTGEAIAPYIKIHIDGIEDTIDELIQSPIGAYHLCVYRYDNGNVVMSKCWYKGSDGTVKSPMFFTSYGEDVAEELTRLYQEEGNPLQ